MHLVDPKKISKTQEYKPIKCPVCKKRICDFSRNYQAKKVFEYTGIEEPDMLNKCANCGRLIGIFV
jgi:DNA-directed RNA polymerase subunit RPC12/RpoP